MKLLLQAIAIFFLFTSSRISQTKPPMFEIRVTFEIGNYAKLHKVIVDAKNIIDAREKAQRVVQYKLSTRVISSREIKR